MRVACDTNILVRAVISPAGAASDLLARLLEEHELVTSSWLLVELLDVLRRQEIRALHKLDERHIRRFITRLY